MPSSPISGPTPPEFKPLRWNLLVISLVAVCCTIFIFLSYFGILKRLCYVLFGVSVPTSQDRRQLLNEAGLDDLSLNIHSHGLETSIVNSLPITQFKKKEEEGEGSRNSECAVCLGEFEEGEWLKHLPNCCHAFHISCIDTWFQTHSSCPLCRSNVSDVTLTHECSVSIYTMLESLRREDFFPERSAHFQMLRISVLQNQALRYESSGSGNN